MRALKEVQFSSCKELYIFDMPIHFIDAVELVGLDLSIFFSFINFK